MKTGHYVPRDVRKRAPTMRTASEGRPYYGLVGAIQVGAKAPTPKKSGFDDGFAVSGFVLSDDFFRKLEEPASTVCPNRLMNIKLIRDMMNLSPYLPS